MPHSPEIEASDDVQHWWEVPAIAHFFYLFQDMLKMKPLEIEELEETLLLHGGPEESSHLAVLAKNLVKGCIRTMSDDNWQDKVAGIWERQQGSALPAPYTALPLRLKVRVLYELCHRRMDSFDPNTMYKKVDMDSLRADCLGEDSSKHIYWYFFGLRLYKELKKDPAPVKKKQRTNSTESPQGWSVVCRQLEDWRHLVDKLKQSRAKPDVALCQLIEKSYLPMVTEVANQRELDERKKLMELAPRRVSTRLEQKRLTRKARGGGGEESSEETSRAEETVEERRQRVARERAQRVEERLRAAERAAVLEDIQEIEAAQEEAVENGEVIEPPPPPSISLPETKKLVICLIREPISSLMMNGGSRYNGTSQEVQQPLYPNGYYRVRNESPDEDEDEPLDRYEDGSNEEEMEFSDAVRGDHDYSMN